MLHEIMIFYHCHSFVASSLLLSLCEFGVGDKNFSVIAEFLPFALMLLHEFGASSSSLLIVNLFCRRLHGQFDMQNGLVEINVAFLHEFGRVMLTFM